ncbi:MAG TPA: hypothetical protein VGC42_15990 [Kofleriaceae bacterium]
MLGGAGRVGSLLARQLAAQVSELVRVDRVASEGVVALDVTQGSAALRALIADATLVVNCLPDAVATSSARQLAAMLSPGCLLVDTLSVKSPYLDALAPADGGTPPFECLSLNPLFAPELGFAGRPVLSVCVRDGELGRRFHTWLQAWGARVVDLPRDDHDRSMAIMQAAVHASVLAFALTLAQLPPALRDGRTGTPPFRTMQLLAARMTGAPAELYWDIQHENPFAAHARAAVAAALADLDGLVVRGDAEGFAGLFARVDAALGAEAPDLRRRCAELFTTLSETP